MRSASISNEASARTIPSPMTPIGGGIELLVSGEHQDQQRSSMACPSFGAASCCSTAPLFKQGLVLLRDPHGLRRGSAVVRLNALLSARRPRPTLATSTSARTTTIRPKPSQSGISLSPRLSGVGGQGRGRDVAPSPVELISRTACRVGSTLRGVRRRSAGDGRDIRKSRRRE